MRELFYYTVALFVPVTLLLAYLLSKRDLLGKKKIYLMSSVILLLGVLISMSSAHHSSLGICSHQVSASTAPLTVALCASVHRIGAIQIARVAIRRQQLLVEVVDSRQTRAKGLMFRRSLAAGHGMLFVHSRDHYSFFWMKNTWIPLDILFFNSEGYLLDVLRYVPPCKADPCAKYWPSHTYRYVIELNAGETLRLGAKIGDRLTPIGNIYQRAYLPSG